MSVKWSYVCQSHTPELVSEMFAAGKSSLELDLQHDRRSAINMLPDFVIAELTEPYVLHWWWLRQHRDCQVSLVNEYGKTLEEERVGQRIQSGLCSVKVNDSFCRLPSNHDGQCQ